MYTHFTGAVTVLEKFVDTLGGKRITGSLRIDGFYFNQPENEKTVEKWAEKLSSAIASL